MFKKTWTDQPDVVEEFPIICAVPAGQRQAEVRGNRSPNSTHYVTVGDLFHSQTFQCMDASTALSLLGLAQKNEVKALPAGVFVYTKPEDPGEKATHWNRRGDRACGALDGPMVSEGGGVTCPACVVCMSAHEHPGNTTAAPNYKGGMGGPG